MLAWLRTHLVPRSAKFVYGSIVALTLVIVLDFEDAAAGTAIVSVVGGLIAVAFAEAYADFLEEMLRLRRRLSAPERRAIAHGVALHMVAGLVPIAFFALVLLRALRLETAYSIAEWAGVGVIGAMAYGAYRSAGIPQGRSILAGVVLTALGVALVLVKLIAEH